MIVRCIGTALTAALLLAPSAAGAQVYAPAGISVQGHAMVRRTADFVRFQIFIGQARNNQQEAVIAGADALIAVLKRDGIDDAAMSVPVTGFIGPQQMLTVTGDVRKPTISRIRAIASDISAMPRPDTLTIQNVQFIPALDSCSDAQRVGIQAAMADARATATDIAAAAGLTVGTVTRVASNLAAGSPNCPARPDGFIQLNGGPAFNVTPAGLDVIIPVTLNVTFSVR